MCQKRKYKQTYNIQSSCMCVVRAVVCMRFDSHTLRSFAVILLYYTIHSVPHTVFVRAVRESHTFDWNDAFVRIYIARRVMNETRNICMLLELKICATFRRSKRNENATQLNCFFFCWPYVCVCLLCMGDRFASIYLDCANNQHLQRMRWTAKEGDKEENRKKWRSQLLSHWLYYCFRLGFSVCLSIYTHAGHFITVHRNGYWMRIIITWALCDVKKMNDTFSERTAHTSSYTVQWFL